MRAATHWLQNFIAALLVAQAWLAFTPLDVGKRVEMRAGPKNALVSVEHGATSSMVKRVTAIADVPLVAGRASTALVQEWIADVNDQALHCFLREHLRNPDLRGAVELAWVIEPDGRTSKIQPVETTPGLNDVSTCIRRRARSWRFPKAKSGTIQLHQRWKFEVAYSKIEYRTVDLGSPGCTPPEEWEEAGFAGPEMFDPDWPIEPLKMEDGSILGCCLGGCPQMSESESRWKIREHVLACAEMAAIKIEVTGPLSSQLEGQGILGRENGLKLCYLKELYKRPGIEGTVELSWSIGADGQVSDVRVATSTSSLAAVGACIEQRAAAWDFDKSKGGQTTVKQSWSFRRTY